MIDGGVVDAYLIDRTERDLFSGVILITQGDQEVFAGGYGQATRAWKIPNTLDTRFDTASVTKLFTSVAVLQCVEQGLIGLDTQAVSYLGLESTSIHPSATLRHLLTHTSGIGDDADEEAGDDYSAVWREHISYLVRQTADMLPLFSQKPGNFAPGDGCRYCNVGFDLAGLMLERATGDLYRDRVKEHVFGRAGMTRSDFFAMDVVEPDVAEGADLADGRWIRNIYSYMPIGSPSGGAHSTVGDLTRFMAAIRGGDLLGPEMTAMFLAPQHQHHVDEYGSLFYGFGLEFSFHPSGPLMFYEKEGINAGTSAVIRHYPDSGVTLAILSNMEEGVWEPREFVHSMIWELA